MITSEYVRTHSGFNVRRSAVILCPLVYALIGGIGAVIGAVIYNLASDWVGGLEVDIAQQ